LPGRSPTVESLHPSPAAPDANGDGVGGGDGDGADQWPAIPSSTSSIDPATVATVLQVVTEMLVDVIGPDYLVGLQIELDTAFDADLELESLEFVALAERLMAHYGDAVDFVGWMATMELDEIITLTVGDLVAFIAAATVGGEHRTVAGRDMEAGTGAVDSPAPAGDR